MVDMIINPDIDISQTYPSIRHDGDVIEVDNVKGYPRRVERILWGRVAPFYDSQGRGAGAIESVRDVTERKKAEQELMRSHQELEALFESTVHALAVTTENATSIPRGIRRG